MLDTLFANRAAWFAIPALLGTGYLVISMVLDQLGGGCVNAWPARKLMKWLKARRV